TAALNNLLGDADHDVRLTALQQMQREQIPLETVAVTRWVSETRDDKCVGPLLDALAKLAAPEKLDSLADIIRGRDYTAAMRRKALTFFTSALDSSSSQRLLQLTEQ